MSPTPRFDAPSISMRSMKRPSSMAIDVSESGMGSPFSSRSAFMAFARIRAVEVLPTPRGPVKR